MMDIVEIVARAIAGEDDHVQKASVYMDMASAAIAAYEAAIAEAQEAEDERMYVEFHK